MGINFNEILSEIHKFWFKKMSSAKWRQSFLGLIVLIWSPVAIVPQYIIDNNSPLFDINVCQLLSIVGTRPLFKVSWTPFYWGLFLTSHWYYLCRPRIYGDIGNIESHGVPNIRQLDCLFNILLISTGPIPLAMGPVARKVSTLMTSSWKIHYLDKRWKYSWLHVTCHKFYQNIRWNDDFEMLCVILALFEPVNRGFPEKGL